MRWDRWQQACFPKLCSMFCACTFLKRKCYWFYQHYKIIQGTALPSYSFAVYGFSQKWAHISSIKDSYVASKLILARLSDLQIILSGKLAKPLSLENVILVRLCQLRVAVLSHLCHLKAKEKSVLTKVENIFLYRLLLVLPTNLAFKQIDLSLQKINLQISETCSAQFMTGQQPYFLSKSKLKKPKAKQKVCQDNFLMPSLVLRKVLVFCSC